MKIKEVCDLTGLSRKTVRLYEEKGLIAPRKELHNGREFRDYTEEDVEMLRIVASLRRAWFTMEEIHTMQSAPEEIPQILDQYRQWLHAQQQTLRGLISAADQLEPDAIGSVAQLSMRLSPEADKLPLPAADITPHFKYLDEIEELRTMQDQEFTQDTAEYQSPLQGGMEDSRAYRQFVVSSSKVKYDDLGVAMGMLQDTKTAMRESSGPVQAAIPEDPLAVKIVKWVLDFACIAALVVSLAVHTWVPLGVAAVLRVAAQIVGWLMQKNRSKETLLAVLILVTVLTVPALLFNSYNPRGANNVQFYCVSLGDYSRTDVYEAMEAVKTEFNSNEMYQKTSLENLYFTAESSIRLAEDAEMAADDVLVFTSTLLTYPGSQGITSSQWLWYVEKAGDGWSVVAHGENATGITYRRI